MDSLSVTLTLLRILWPPPPIQSLSLSLFLQPLLLSLSPLHSIHVFVTNMGIMVSYFPLIMQRLLKACDDGDARTVQQLLNEKTDIECRDEVY